MGRQLSQEVHLMDYFQVIRKRKSIILACLFVILTTVTIANYAMEPIYEARARIMIDEELRRSPVTGVTMEYEPYTQLQSLQFQTHFDLITSYPILERVFNALPLDKAEEQASPNILKKAIIAIMQNFSKAKQFIKGLFSSEKKEVNPLVNDPYLLTYYRTQALRKKVEVQQVKNTRLVDVRARDTNPELARDIANGVAQAYIEYTRSSRLEATKASIAWLSEQLEDMKKEIRESEKEFYKFKRKEGIFSIEGKQKIHAQRIAELTSAYSDCKSKRLAISATIKGLSGTLDKKEYDKVALGTVDNALLESLHRDLVNAEIELSRLKKIFKRKHPQIIAIKTKIERIKEKFDQELKRTLSSLQSEYAILQDKEQTLLSTIRRYESEALDLNKKEMKYAMLEREIETNKELYNLLFSNFGQANVIEAMPTTNIRLIEAAVSPLVPAKPQKTLNLILGTILGLMIGLGLSFFLEYLDRTINTPEDVDRYLGLPILVAIPKVNK